MAITRVRFTEGSSGFVRFQLTDQAGEPVIFDGLTEGTLTLWDMETSVPGASPAEGIINNRDQQDVLPEGSPLEENNVSYESNGYVRWDLQPEDNVIVNPRRQVERHRAMFVFGWEGGSLNYELEIEVVNLRRAG